LEFRRVLVRSIPFEVKERRLSASWPRYSVIAAGIDAITEYLGKEAESLLSFTSKGIPRDMLMLPGPDHVDRAWGGSDRKPAVLVNLQRLYGHGRLRGTGYLSILPVDQGVEHSAAAPFAPTPIYL